MRTDATPPAAPGPRIGKSRTPAQDETAGAPARVALITTELSVGGAERCLVNLALGLEAAGDFQPVVYSLAPPPRPPRDGLVRRLRDAGVPVEFLGVTAPWQFVSAVMRLRRALAARKPHVVQTFLFHANVVGTLAAKLAGDTVIVWGVRVADPRRRRHLAERMLSAHVKRIVCVSGDVAEFCRGRVRLPGGKLTVIPNGIDVGRYEGVQPADRQSLGVPPDANLLLCIGRLDRQKGLDWLLPLLGGLFEERPRLHLAMAGEGPERTALDHQCRSLGIAERVHWLGWRPDVPELLATSSVLLLPSRWEGMPNVVLEAMAAGRPVLAAGVSGVAELLGPGEEGQCFEPENERDFLEKLAVLLDDPHRAAAWGEANRRRARQHFSLEAMCDAYRQLYRSLLTRR